MKLFNALRSLCRGTFGMVTGSKSLRARKSQPIRPAVEMLEDRQLMSANLSVLANLTVAQQPTAETAMIRPSYYHGHVLQAVDLALTKLALSPRAADQLPQPGDARILDKAAAAGLPQVTGPLSELAIPVSTADRIPIQVDPFIDTSGATDWSSIIELLNQANSSTRSQSDGGIYIETGVAPTVNLTDQVLGDRVTQTAQLFESVAGALRVTGLEGIFDSMLHVPDDGGSLNAHDAGVPSSALVSFPGLPSTPDPLSFRSAADLKASLSGLTIHAWEGDIFVVESDKGYRKIELPPGYTKSDPLPATDFKTDADALLYKIKDGHGDVVATVLIPEPKNKDNNTATIKLVDDTTKKTPNPAHEGRDTSGTAPGDNLLFQQLSDPREDGAAEVDMNKLVRSLVTSFQSTVNPPENGPSRGGESTGGGIPGIAPGIADPDDQPTPKNDQSPGGNPLIVFEIGKGPGRISG